MTLYIFQYLSVDRSCPWFLFGGGGGGVGGGGGGGGGGDYVVIVNRDRMVVGITTTCPISACHH